VAEGRWPANVIMDLGAAEMLDAQTGTLHSQDPSTRSTRSTTKGVTEMGRTGGASLEYGDSGGASRFVYVIGRGEMEAGSARAPDWNVIEGDCVEAMRAMPEASVDAVVCDPPYGLEFMGKEWDRLGGQHWRTDRSPDTTGRGSWFGDNHDSPRYGGSPHRQQEWHEAWAREALRVLKPGGHLLAFGGTRTYHRLACAVEDAGFEIRDEILFGRGLDANDYRLIMEAWRAWSERAPDAGMRFVDAGSSAPAPVLIATERDESPASALIAELASSEAHHTHAERWRSALSPAVASTTACSALVTIAGNRHASHDPTCSPGSTALSDAPEWLAASRAPIIRAAEALRIWLGVEQSLKPGATDALCAALSSALKHITCAHSETFRSYGTTWQTVCASATIATTTASTAVNLLGFTADTLATLDPQPGGDANGSLSRGPLAWVYGSGFPSLKSLDVSKAIDKAAGAEREVVGRHVQSVQTRKLGAALKGSEDGSLAWQHDITAPATPDAERWQGWGTALKPAHEPIVLARKPLGGTVAGNVLAHGTGALNVDGCRIGPPPGYSYPNGAGGNSFTVGGAPDGTRTEPVESPAGRWPANVCLDPEAAAILDEQTGDLGQSLGGGRGISRSWEGGPVGAVPEPQGFGDSGGASRFLYVAKASSAERNAGLDGFERAITDDGRQTPIDNPYLRGETERRNVHPTVKPIELMRWLVRLVTPPGGTVLDPFTGSGTTGCAAVLEGFRFVGCEREPEYAEIARARIRWWSEHPDGMKLVERLDAEREHAAKRDAGQIGLF
jgi:DNA modification methylase